MPVLDQALRSRALFMPTDRRHRHPSGTASGALRIFARAKHELRTPTLLTGKVVDGDASDFRLDPGTPSPPSAIASPRPKLALALPAFLPELADPLTFDPVGSSACASPEHAHVLELRTGSRASYASRGRLRMSCGQGSSRGQLSQLMRVAFRSGPANPGRSVGTIFASSAWAMTFLSTLQEEAALAPAMRFVLAVGRARTLCAALSPEWKSLTELWDLAEQHHPEEAWLTSTYLGGARSLAELCARAPKNALASAVALHSQRRPVSASRISSSAFAVATA